jgi:hypothetical protein
LSKVQIKLSSFESSHGLKVKGTIPLNEDDRIKYNEKRFTYIVLTRDESFKYPQAKIS